MERWSSKQQPSPAALPEEALGLERYREAVEKYLATLDRSSPLGKAIAETIEAGGKRLRPVIALLACEAVSGSHEKALPVAGVFELAHAASLVQDDIIDESATRHGREAAHKKYGTMRAILLSDVMIFEIFTELAKYGDSIPQKRLAEVISLVGKAARLAADGEFFETTLAEKGSVTEEEYVKLAGLKTGALFAAAAAAGALVGGGTREQVESAYEFGLNLGVSFQIRDDVLDIAGNEQTTGKPVLKDLQNNATNLVLVHAMANADPYQKAAISAMVYKKWFTSDEVQKLTDALEDLGSVRHASNAERKYAAKAKLALESFPDSGARSLLVKLTEGLEARIK